MPELLDEIDRRAPRKCRTASAGRPEFRLRLEMDHDSSGSPPAVELRPERARAEHGQARMPRLEDLRIGMEADIGASSVLDISELQTGPSTSPREKDWR